MHSFSIVRLLRYLVCRCNIGIDRLRVMCNDIDNLWKKRFVFKIDRFQKLMARHSSVCLYACRRHVLRDDLAIQKRSNRGHSSLHSRLRNNKNLCGSNTTVGKPPKYEGTERERARERWENRMRNEEVRDARRGKLPTGSLSARATPHTLEPLSQVQARSEGGVVQKLVRSKCYVETRRSALTFFFFL